MEWTPHQEATIPPRRTLDPRTFLLEVHPVTVVHGRRAHLKDSPKPLFHVSPPRKQPPPPPAEARQHTKPLPPLMLPNNKQAQINLF
mmetsp:Transcript_8784/g.32501  ORF Transcript_8784/g.32501 Transcript_8784/m.32501 type:complete len:87 (-) Transcript_8784:1201-1461(-)